MDHIFQKNNTIIFDLDGTLYEDTEHFSYYADQLKLELTETEWDRYEAEYQKIVSGHHIVSIGKVYDVVRSYVLRIDANSLKVLRAWTWSGQELSQEQRIKYYSEPIELNFETMIAIGDGWWLPNVCAKHFGVTDTYSAYLRTKEYMATDQFVLTRITDLRDSLLYLKDRKNMILLTNSDSEDVNRLLRLLNLDDIFEHMITQAQKPQHTLRHLKQIMNDYHVEAKHCLSIGDNYINEIAPAKNLGMNTIFIDMHQYSYPGYQGVKVRSISEALLWMRQA